MVVEKYQKYLKEIDTKLKDSITSLFNQADTIIEKAKQKAEEINVPVTIAVVDSSGRLIAEKRMEEALLVSLDLAVKKAYTAVAMKAPTHKLKDSSQPGAPLYQIESNTSTGGGIVTFGGGLPIYLEGKIIGGIGVSGGSVEEDQIIAEAGIC